MGIYRKSAVPHSMNVNVGEATMARWKRCMGQCKVQKNVEFIIKLLDLWEDCHSGRFSERCIRAMASEAPQEPEPEPEPAPEEEEVEGPEPAEEEESP